MISTSSYLSKLVVDLPTFNNTAKSELPFQKFAEVSIHAIQDGFSSKRISEIATKENILEMMFDLRKEVLKWAATENIDLNEYVRSAYDKSIKLGLKQYSNSRYFDETLSLVYELFGAIATGISTKFDLSNFNQAVKALKDINLTYQSLRLFELAPVPQTKVFKNLIDESLKLEIALIVSELISKGSIKASKNRIENELIPFLKRTIERFGAYSSFVGFWYPSEEDERQIVRNIKIHTAKLEMEHKPKTKAQKVENLHHLITA